MKKLLSFEYAKLRPRPMGVLMVLGVFALIVCLEMLFGGIAYSIGFFGFKSQPVIASLIINIGMWVTKVIVLVLVGRLVLENKAPEAPSPIRRWLTSEQVSKFFVLSLLAVVSFRLAYDSVLGDWVLKTFGVDEGFTESIKLIMEVPALGIIFFCLIAPIYEEIIFRGMLFGGLRRKGFGFVGAALLSAILFSVMHMNIAQGVNAFFLGLLFALVYEATGNLSAAIMLHMINNIYVISFAEWLDLKVWDMNLLTRAGFTLMGIGFLSRVLMIYNKKAAQLSAEPLDFS